MIGTVARIGVASLSLVPAAAGTSAVRPPLVLRAAPAHLSLVGNGRSVVHVTNAGTRAVIVDVASAGFALGLHGRPRVIPAGGVRSAMRWLVLRPRRFALGPHADGSLVVASRVPRRAEPGDHDALVLLSTRAVKNARVAVRVRLGVTVVVRAPGKVARRLVLRRLRVIRRRRVHALELVVANRGNITELVAHTRAVVASARTGRRLATLGAVVRKLLPRTVGALDFPFRRRLRGRMTVEIVIPADTGRAAVRRTYRLRL